MRAGSSFILSHYSWLSVSMDSAPADTESPAMGLEHPWDLVPLVPPGLAPLGDHGTLSAFPLGFLFCGLGLLASG